MQLLDPTAVAALLGLHPRTIVLYFRAGKIPGAFRLGGRHWRISRADLETYLAARARNDNKAMTHLDRSAPDGCNTEAPAKPPDPLPAPYEIRLPAGLRSFTIIIGQ
jgi:excisionase family DNA binding protein